MRSPHGAFGLACLLVVCAPSAASATIIEAMSLDELVRGADAVALVTCVDERALRDQRNRIVTDYELRLDEVMKGSAAPGSHLTMRRLGGIIGDLGMRVEGEPSMQPGQRYVVFLRRLPGGGPLRPVGMSQGVMPVEETRGVLTVQPGAAGLSLVQRGAGGGLHPAPAALLHAESFERLRERVEESRARPGAVRP